ncbi:hypothetical protein HK096_009679, partial [Nowakowskiella sp. JEL0078]
MKKTVILLLLLALNCANHLQSNAQAIKDVCANWNDTILISHTDALACLDSFKMPSSEITNQILDTTLTILNLYPYYDVVESSPDSQFPSKISINDRIAAIRNKIPTYTTERAFHEEIGLLFDDFKDAHSGYSHCFRSFNWIQPWSIVADYPNALLETSSSTAMKPRLKLNYLVTDNLINAGAGILPQQISQIASLLKTRLGHDPVDYLNATVLEIDGIKAIDYVSQFAKDNSIGVKDESSRFNYVLSKSTFRNGKFLIFDGPLVLTTQIPSKPARSYKLQLQSGSTVDLSVPWFMIQPISTLFTSQSNNITGRNIYYSSLCVRDEYIPIFLTNSLSASSTLEARSQRNAFSDTGNIVFSSKKLTQPVSQVLTNLDQYFFPDSKSTADRLKLRVDLNKGLKLAVTNGPWIFADNYTSFYGLPDKKTAVWVFTSFAPQFFDSDGSQRSLTTEETTKWIDNIFVGLATIQKKGYTRLIFDVSQNGGGLICVAQIIAQTLFKELELPVNDMRYTDLLETIANASIPFTGKGRYFAPDGKEVINSNSKTNWFTSRSKGPDNTLGKYTQQYRSTSCDAGVVDTLKTYMNQTGLQQNFWKPENLAILSDGTCGSSCSFLSRSLHEQKNVSVYVYGGPTDNGKTNTAAGVKGTPFAWCGFDGGPVLSNEYMIRSEVNEVSGSLALPNGAIVPGSASSWVNLVAANNITSMPLKVNWSIPISATYQISKLNKMTEWYFQASNEVVNTLNPFEDRLGLWDEVSSRMDKRASSKSS